MHAYRRNIKLLAKGFGSQTALASKLGNKIPQPRISDIINGKRRLYPWEDQIFEQALNIPKGWLRDPDLIPLFYPFIIYINMCRSIGAPFTNNYAFQKMEERLNQMPEYLKEHAS